VLSLCINFASPNHQQKQTPSSSFSKKKKPSSYTRTYHFNNLFSYSFLVSFYCKSISLLLYACHWYHQHKIKLNYHWHDWYYMQHTIALVALVPSTYLLHYINTKSNLKYYWYHWYYMHANPQLCDSRAPPFIYLLLFKSGNHICSWILVL
jgi:hypothetical protein